MRHGVKNNVIVLFLMFWVLAVSKANAQDYIPAWKIGVGGGYMNYFGDVSPYTIRHWEDWDKVFKFFQYNKYYVPEASFGISVERYLSPGITLMLQLNQGLISMSDRYREPDGDYDKNALHWNRALNFRTSIQDGGLSFVFRSNNGRMFPVNSFLAPYFIIGGGITHFDVKGDLYDAEGKPYNYADPNVINDGSYETSLRPLMTETLKEYPDVVPYVNAGLGLSLNLSKRVSLAVQTDIKYAFSDYLDDVSGKYKAKYTSPEAAYAAHPGTNVVDPYRPNRGNNDGVNDFYIFNKVSLNINLGNKANRYFHAPPIYLPGSYLNGDSSTISANLPVNENKDTSEQYARSFSDSATLRIESSLQDIRSELLSLRFAHIDQNYIIRQNAVEADIQTLQMERSRLQGIKNPSTEDGLRARLAGYQIDSLNNELVAIHQARVQLRKEMAYSPIVTEYSDSTKIMIYKGHSANTDSLYMPLLGTSSTDEQDSLYQWRKSASEKENAEVKNYYTPADSIRMELSRLQHNAETAGDTALYQQLQIMKWRLDSVEKNTYGQSSYSADSLKNQYYIQQDSLKIIALNRQADSLRRVNYYRIQEKTPRRNAIQRFFDKFKRNKGRQEDNYPYQYTPNNMDTAQYTEYPVDSLSSFNQSNSTGATEKNTNTVNPSRAYDTAYYNRSNAVVNPANNGNRQYVPNYESYQSTQPGLQSAEAQLLQQNQDEIERLQGEIRSLRSYNSRSYNQPPTVIFRDDDKSARQDRRDRRQTSEFNRDMIAAIAGSNRDRTPANISPNIILPPAYGTDNSNTEELEDIRKQLNALKQQYDTTNAGNEQWANKILSDTSATTGNDSEMVGMLRTKVDSLSRQLALLKQRQPPATPATEKVLGNEADLSNYPTVSTYFATGASTLKPTEKAKIKSIAEMAKKYPKTKLLIQGFTDGTGNKRVNEILSQKRCAAVKQILVQQYGIQSQRLVTDANITETRGSGDPLKRRVDIKFTE